jgi:hypothetical protein
MEKWIVDTEKNKSRFLSNYGGFNLPFIRPSSSSGIIREGRRQLNQAILDEGDQCINFCR